MRDIPKRNKWKHYTGLFRFRSSATVSPQVSYTESTRTMVITDSNVWPVDAEYGEILYGNTPFDIKSRVNNTTIILDGDVGLGANYTGPVSWQRQRYTFNKQFTKIHYLMNLDSRIPLAYLDQPTFYERQRLVRLLERLRFLRCEILSNLE